MSETNQTKTIRIVDSSITTILVNISAKTLKGLADGLRKYDSVEYTDPPGSPGEENIRIVFRKELPDDHRTIDSYQRTNWEALKSKRDQVT